jgi:O-acetylhomoserine/O-acetylserine sulfhydrylase-like pyridoxal-dependent enzyme
MTTYLRLDTNGIADVMDIIADLEQSLAKV